MSYDLVVIGSGPGGYVAAIRAAQLGLKTACVEKDKTLGGTCLNVGCIPSKTLLQTTEHYSWLKNESQELGITAKEVALDFGKMMQRKEKVVQGLVQGVAGLFKRHGVTSIQGTAKFTSPNTLEVTQGTQKQKIDAKNFIIATGSEPIPLPFLPFDEQQVVSSTGALSLPKIPKKLVVIGGGVIGVELASVYNRLGSSVTIVEMLERICIANDEALSKALLQILKKQGLTFHLGTKVTQAKKNNGEYTLSLEGGEHKELQADVVLVAVGRRPYTTGLGISEIGITLNKGMIPIDRNFRTVHPHIYAIGDVIEGPMLAHKASAEGVAVAEIIAGQSSSVNYMAVPNIIYTHPEVAALGLTEKEARDAGLEVITGTAFFRGNPRARCAGYTEGFVKVIGAGKRGTLVGMHIIGQQASEMIHSGMVAIEQQGTLLELANSPFGHPTLSEAVKEACGNALNISVNE